MTASELKELEKELWNSADTLRANSDLKASEYSTPVLGLIFLKFADNNYKRYEKAILKEYAEQKEKRIQRTISDIAIEKCGFYLPDHARYHHLLNLPEEEDVAKAIKKAMESIEEYKPELKGVLPQEEYFRLTRTDSSIPGQLLKNFSNIPEDASGDLFGQIYEYFLANFAMAEGQGGGEFFTPRSVVRLMVEIIEPHRGTVFDPACGSGGMFVQSAQFIEEHRKEWSDGDGDIFVYGQEKNLETVKLAKMNLAVNGLRGDIRQGISYYEDHFDCFEQFDYVLANPPFNVDDVNYDKVKNNPSFNTYGLPRNKSKNTKKKKEGIETVPNANYLWINLFVTSLKPDGRAALVMPNSASDARHSEADIRKNLIENNLIYSMLTLPSNMFYTVTLPATLWFFDRAKQDDKILFIDARNIFTQIDRAHREFSPEQIQNISLINQLHRGHRQKFTSVIDNYFDKGMEKLAENKELITPLAEQILDLLKTDEAKTVVAEFISHWGEFTKLRKQYDTYKVKIENNIDKLNTQQHILRKAFDPFFEVLHEGLKTIDKLVRSYDKKKTETAQKTGKKLGQDRASRDLKQALEQLHTDVKNAENYYKHIYWLQERFPKAAYEDVTGLCKLATKEEIREQDYSLNPGRYVGVVIEEDGKTEEEFISELSDMQDLLRKLNQESKKLENMIDSNMAKIIGE